MISFELRDTNSFLEAIAQRDYYEQKKNGLQSKIKDDEEELSKIQSGKKTLKSVFSKGGVEE